MQTNRNHAKIALNQKNKQAIFFLSATYIPAKRVKKKTGIGNTRRGSARTRVERGALEVARSREGPRSGMRGAEWQRDEQQQRQADEGNRQCHGWGWGAALRHRGAPSVPLASPAAAWTQQDRTTFCQFVPVPVDAPRTRWERRKSFRVAEEWGRITKEIGAVVGVVPQKDGRRMLFCFGSSLRLVSCPLFLWPPRLSCSSPRRPSGSGQMQRG